MMLRSTILLLIGLRLVIGWHFLFEGLHKIHSTYIGKTETNRPFSSAGYFNEAEGPFGKVMRGQIGDNHLDAIARLTPMPVPEGEEASKVPLPARMPPALDKEWNAYFQQFAEHYQLSPDEKQAAEAKLQQAKEKVVVWLTSTDDPKLKKKVKRKFQSTEVEIEQSTPERLQEYKNKLAEVRELVERKNPALGRDVEKIRLRTAKGEADKLRDDLLTDLDEYTANMKKSLGDVVRGRIAPDDILKDDASDTNEYVLGLLTLGAGDGAKADRCPAVLAAKWNAYKDAFVAAFKPTPEQTAEIEKRLTRAKEHVVYWLSDQEEFPGTPWPKPGMPQRITAFTEQIEKKSPQADATRKELFDLAQKETKALRLSLDGVLTADQAAGIAPDVARWKNLQYLDWITRWGLTLIGACLLLGCFTRSAALGAAGFLLMTYLSRPSFPWLPAAPASEGNYVYVNKNVVEFLALLVIASLPTGKWFGVDRLLSHLRLRRKQG